MVRKSKGESGVSISKKNSPLLIEYEILDQIHKRNRG